MCYMLSACSSLLNKPITCNLHGCVPVIVVTSKLALWLLLCFIYETCMECVLDCTVRCRGLRERKLRSMLGANVGLLSKRERHAVAELLQEHAYLFNNWPPPGAHPCLRRGCSKGKIACDFLCQLVGSNK